MLTATFTLDKLQDYTTKRVIPSVFRQQGIFSKIRFYCFANLGELIKCFSSWNHQKTVVFFYDFRGIEVN